MLHFHLQSTLIVQNLMARKTYDKNQGKGFFSLNILKTTASITLLFFQKRLQITDRIMKQKTCHTSDSNEILSSKQIQNHLTLMTH